MSLTPITELVHVGYEEFSPGRTIRDCDVAMFAGLSGDYMPLHTDDQYSKGTSYGEPIAHGLLGLSIASGLWTRTNLSRSIANHMVALLNVDWNFKHPILFGDTVTLGLRVIELEPTSSGNYYVMRMERWLDSDRFEGVQVGVFKNLLQVT